MSEKLIDFVNLFRFVRLLAKEHMQPFFTTDFHNGLFRNSTTACSKTLHAFYPAMICFRSNVNVYLTQIVTWKVNMEGTLGNPAVYR